MDLAKYLSRKASNHIQLVKAGNSFAMISARYDPETGTPLPAEIDAISLDDMMRLEETLHEQISNVQAIIADMKALGQ